MSDLKKRRAGILVPLASILTENSFESGDIASLAPFGEFLSKAGFSILQLLPLNDTGIGKSPYSSLSSLAIDPLYISLHELGITLKSRRRDVSTHRIHHNRIRVLKVKALRDDYKDHFEKKKEEALEFSHHYPWVNSYSVFRTLFEKYNGLPWWEWKEEYQDPNRAKEYVLEKEHETFYFFIYLQKIAYEQLKAAKEKLESLGVYLKGDMPILTSRNSCDVWFHRNLFDLSLQAGAPPDAFSDHGQTWGFPVIQWGEMEKEGYDWWKERLKYLEHFYHLYRIDHVIGMYRIWAIPENQSTAKFGWFHPQKGVSKDEFLEAGLDPQEFIDRKLIQENAPNRFIFYWDFWKSPSYQELPEPTKAKLWEFSVMHLEEDETNWLESGERVLDALDKFSSLMPCAEDLGAVPEFIRNSLLKRKMLGIDVNRWTRSLDDGSYIPKEGYRELALSVLSTHDTSLAMDWWTSLQGDEKSYAESFFFPEGVPKDSAQILSGLLDFSFSTNSMYSIQLLQDVLFEGQFAILEDWEKHRINTPGTPEEGNWDYRFRFTMEQLKEEEGLVEALKKKLQESNRLGNFKSS